MHVALLSSCASIHNMHTHFPSPLAGLLLVSFEAVLEAVGLLSFSDVEVESGHKDRQGSAIPNDPSKVVKRSTTRAHRPKNVHASSSPKLSKLSASICATFTNTIAL